MMDRLQNLIQTQSDINLLVEVDGGFETDYDIVLSQESNADPSPVGRNQTSTTRMNDDVLTIRGWIRPLLHNGRIVDTSDYVRRVKSVMASQKYTTDTLATITNADGVFSNMVLKRFSVRRQGSSPQEMLVSMTWEAMNLSGSIDQPTFSIGGIT